MDHRSTIISFASLLMLLLANGAAFGQNTATDPLFTDSIMTLTAEDTLRRREIRQIRLQEKYEQSGPFFSHEDRPGRKAALYSFGFPGLGQIYNRKYWKLPIVYGVIGTGLYFGITNGQELKRYNSALEIRLSGGTDEFSGFLTEAALISRRNIYRRNTELSALLSTLFYGLNIIDAVVDAHLFDFDINDDLSLRWRPELLTGNNAVFIGIGLSLTLN